MTRRGFFGRILGGIAAAVAAPLLKPVPKPESIYWLGQDGMYLFVSNTEEFAFGFTGFQPCDGPGDIVGRMGIRIACQQPRRLGVIHGVTE